MEEQIKILLEWVFKEVIQYGFRHLFWVVLIVISTLFFGRNYRKRIKALENGQEEADRRQEEASRRAEGFERLLAGARTQTIVVQVPSLSSGFSGQATVNKRIEPTLRNNLELAPGAGRIAGELICQLNRCSKNSIK